MRIYFPNRYSGAALHSLSKLYDVPVGFVTTPSFEQCFVKFEVAECWLLLSDLSSLSLHCLYLHAISKKVYLRMDSTHSLI